MILIFGSVPDFRTSILPLFFINFVASLIAFLHFVLVITFLSRTGSKLGISPLMLAAMNGHTAAVKLLLDMGSDINAQIETNRNTALTLACFLGRHEVVSILLNQKANVEHRAKTGVVSPDISPLPILRYQLMSG